MFRARAATTAPFCQAKTPARCGSISGPSSICFQIRLETGARVKKLIDHKGEFEMALQGAPVRFLTPVPGTSDPGIEIPAPQRRIIELSQTISQSLSGFDSEPESISASLALPVGRDVSGEIVQRPTVEVLPGTIRANIPGRVALKVSSAAESRIILDQCGAESLGGRGDFLFQSPALQNATRGQAAIVGALNLESLL